jgi:acetylornithine/succinyldiaminopimelate/putrescine aminotransferase
MIRRDTFGEGEERNDEVPIAAPSLGGGRFPAAAWFKTKYRSVATAGRHISQSGDSDRVLEAARQDSAMRRHPAGQMRQIPKCLT